MNWPSNKKFVGDVCAHFPHGPVPKGHLDECDARILVIGEAPGKDENARGEPFVGRAGRLLNHKILEAVGLARNDCYITNVVPYQPPVGNEFSSIPLNILQKAHLRIKDKIQRFKGSVVVPLGASALEASTDKKGIMKWGGSVLPVAGKWLVPSIRPAAMLRSPA